MIDAAMSYLKRLLMARRLERLGFSRRLAQIVVTSVNRTKP